jgi:Uma2 family endonuclease
MVESAVQQTATFEEYVDFCAQQDERYELVRGELQRMNPPSVLHFRIAKFLERIFDDAIAQYLDANQWEAFRDAGQRTEQASSRLPDIAILSREEANRLLSQTAVFQSPALLVVEIVSPSSASEDYEDKLREYQAIGVQEYWIVDPDAIGSASYIGFPKQPTITVHSLVDGQYQAHLFREGDRIKSLIFPELALLVHQIFEAGR